MFQRSRQLFIRLQEVQFSAIRASGPGGQHVNKVASAIHLQFNIKASSLPADIKERLLLLSDRRISKDGTVNIKAQEHRSLIKNKESALLRLNELIKSVVTVHKSRKPTKPSRSAKKKRLEQKTRRGRIKALRSKVTGE